MATRVTAVVGKEEIMQSAQSSLLVALSGLRELAGLNSRSKDSRYTEENRVHGKIITIKENILKNV